MKHKNYIVPVLACWLICLFAYSSTYAAIVEVPAGDGVTITEGMKRAAINDNFTDLDGRVSARGTAALKDTGTTIGTVPLYVDDGNGDPSLPIGERIDTSTFGSLFTDSTAFDTNQENWEWLDDNFLYVSTPPTYSNEACTSGQYAIDSTALRQYLCAATGNWDYVGSTGYVDWDNPQVGGTPIAFNDYAHGTVVGLVDTLDSSTTLTVDAGDLIIAFVSGDQMPTDVECGTNTLSVIETLDVGDFYVSALTVANASASSVACTVNYSVTAQYTGMQVASYSNVAISNAVDQTACNASDGGFADDSAACDTASTNTVNLSSEPMATTVADEAIVVGVMLWNNTATPTASSPYTKRSGTDTLWHLFDTNVTSTGSYPGQTVATIDPQDTYGSISVSLKEL